MGVLNRATPLPGVLSQSITSLISDLAYFALVAFLGWAKVVDGQAIVALLGFYGAGRVTIGMRKSEARSAYYEGAASTSGQMRAVRAPIVDAPDEDPPPKRASGTGMLAAPLPPPARPRDPRRE